MNKQTRGVFEVLITKAAANGTIICGDYHLTVDDEDLDERLYELAKEFVERYEAEDKP